MNRTSCKIDIERLAAQAPLGREDLVGQEIAAWRVSAAVTSLHCDPMNIRARSFGFDFTPGRVPCIADPYPIDGAQHDRTLAIQQYNAAGGQRIVSIRNEYPRFVAQRATVAG